MGSSNCTCLRSKNKQNDLILLNENQSFYLSKHLINILYF